MSEAVEDLWRHGPLCLDLEVELLLKSEETEMQSRGGLHPYADSLLFILGESQHDHRGSRQQRAAIMSGDVRQISNWQTVRMLGRAFDRSNADVARDLIETFRTLENADWAP